MSLFSHPQELSPATKKLQKSEKKSATSMGIVESAKYLASSPYIRNLALLVIAYGMSINIVEVTWKGKLKAAFPDPNDYSAFMGNFSTATGIVTFIMMLVGRFVFTRSVLEHPALQCRRLLSMRYSHC